MSQAAFDVTRDVQISKVRIESESEQVARTAPGRAQHHTFASGALRLQTGIYHLVKYFMKY